MESLAGHFECREEERRGHRRRPSCIRSSCGRHGFIFVGKKKISQTWKIISSRILPWAMAMAMSNKCLTTPRHLARHPVITRSLLSTMLTLVVHSQHCLHPCLSLHSITCTCIMALSAPVLCARVLCPFLLWYFGT